MILGVIPARFGSTRLMGKPLADICGKTMIQRTYESAKRSKLLNDLIIAVDDEKVFDVANAFGAHVKLTPKSIQTGSDRIAYVAKSVRDAEIVVNIQGDEPFIDPLMIDQAIEPLLFDKTILVSTLAKKIDNIEELKSETIPKVVFDYNNFALYFSRYPIPYIRDDNKLISKIANYSIYKHIGLYVYRKDALMKFTSLPPTDLENAEKLEQLRMIEHGMKIKVVVTDFDSISVDTPDDLEKARNYYKKYYYNYEN